MALTAGTAADPILSAYREHCNEVERKDKNASVKERLNNTRYKHHARQEVVLPMLEEQFLQK